MSNLEIIEADFAKAAQGIKGQWFDDVSFEWYNYVVSPIASYIKNADVQSLQNTLITKFGNTIL